VFLRQETVKTPIEQCEGSVVAEAPVEYGVWPTSAEQDGPSSRMRCDLPLNRPIFLGLYDELHHADVSVILNKNAGSQFGVVLRSDGAWHLRNSVRELSDQASCS
jgi:hypothetical protein